MKSCCFLTLRGLIVLTTMDLRQSWWMEYTWNPSMREAETLGSREPERAWRLTRERASEFKESS